MRDIPVTLNPGQKTPMPLGTVDFMFMKSTPAEVLVTVNNDTIRMKSGDDRSIPSGVNEIYLESESALPIEVVVTVGMGHYKRQVIEGNVTVFNGLLGIDGEIRPDTTVEKDFSLMQHSRIVEPLQQGRIIEQLFNTGGYIRQHNRGVTVYNGELWAHNNYSELWTFNFDTRSWTKQGNGFGLQDVSGNHLNSGGSNVLFTWDGELYATTINIDQDRIFKFVGAGKFRDTGMRFPFELPPCASIVPHNGKLYCFGMWSNINAADRDLWVIDIETGQYTTKNIGRATKGAAIVGDVIYVIRGADQWTGNTFYTYDAETLDYLGSFPAFSEDGITPDLVSWLVGHGGYLIGGDAYNNQLKTMQLVEPVTRDRGFTGDIHFSGGRTNLIRGVAKTIFDETSAAFYVESIGGALTASGQLIKAIIEQSLGECPDDYLDHVYAVKVEGGDSLSGGYQSFARLGFADDFTLPLPANVTLTVDQYFRGI